MAVDHLVGGRQRAVGAAAIAFITKARIELFNGRPADGQIYLSQVRILDRNMPELIMLQAEFDHREGKVKEARDAAAILRSNVATPQWIRMFAEEFLKRTQ